MRSYFFALALCFFALPGRAEVADSASVRVVVEGVCGSGTICGASAGSAYVVSNAHVTGTSVGRVIGIDIVSDGKKKRVTGRIVWAAYSSARLADASIVEVNGLTSKVYEPMLRVAPVGAPYSTLGSPRCVWPLVQKEFLRPDIRSDSPLMLGDPDAIGGQSGSGICNASRQMVGLVTWSWGGRCAGQQTRSLADIARTNSLLEVSDRPRGLVEVQAPGERSVTEEGIFSVAAVRILDLPIWVDSSPPVDPNCVVLTVQEKKIIDLIRERSDVFTPGFDWALLIKLILDLLAMFRK
jgi:hypothetical protein